MLVKDLKEKLENVPDDYEIFIYNSLENQYLEVCYADKELDHDVFVLYDQEPCEEG